MKNFAICLLASQWALCQPFGLPSALSSSRLTDWVVENLEDGGRSITSSSTVQAGENDTLPIDGLVIGDFRILAADAPHQSNDGRDEIRLLLGRNGWGTGVHPTTRLCLEWLADHLAAGDVLLDYGCGSGILSIAGLHRGVAKCIGVDVEAEALVTAARNVEFNGYGEERFEGLHTREILPFMFTADVCIANILIGQLVRPSMVVALTSNLRAGGRLCLSGIRPSEVDALKAAYPDFEWLDEAKLSAQETEGSLESYGFDCGEWARVVGRKVGIDDVEAMSELAVS